MPNQLNNGNRRGILFFWGNITRFLAHTYLENLIKCKFRLNECVVYPYSVKIGLATDWSLRFYALASVSAFFVFCRRNKIF